MYRVTALSRALDTARHRRETSLGSFRLPLSWSSAAPEPAKSAARRISTATAMIRPTDWGIQLVRVTSRGLPKNRQNRARTPQTREYFRQMWPLKFQGSWE